MSIGASSGIAGSLAGVPVAQRGPEAERVQQERASQQRQAFTDFKAEAAAGIGATDEDQGVADRDADGRRLWEEMPPGSGEADGSQPGDPPQPPSSRDPSGASGTQLDVSG